MNKVKKIIIILIITVIEVLVFWIINDITYKRRIINGMKQLYKKDITISIPEKDSWACVGWASIEGSNCVENQMNIPIDEALQMIIDYLQLKYERGQTLTTSTPPRLTK